MSMPKAFSAEGLVGTAVQNVQPNGWPGPDAQKGTFDLGTSVGKHFDQALQISGKGNLVPVSTWKGAASGKGKGFARDVEASAVDNVKANKIPDNMKVRACPFVDFRLKDVSTAPVVENIAPVTSVTYVAPAPVIDCIAPAPDDGSFPGSSADKYDGLFSKPATYSVVQKDSPWPLRLELLIPAFEPPTSVLPDAATSPPPSGGDSGGICCPSPRGEDMFEEVETISWEQYLLEKEEGEKDKEKEKEKERAVEEWSIDLWEVYMLRKEEKGIVGKQKEKEQKEQEEEKQETAEDQVEKEPRVVPPLWEWVPLEGEEKEEEQKGDEKENEEKEKMEGKVRRRKACSGFLSASEKAWARAREINRSLRPLLFPGLRKRKYNSLLFGLDLRTIERANAERLKAEKKKEEMKEKEKEEKEMKEKMGKPDLFVFGRSEEEKEKEKDPKIFVFGSAGNSEMEKVTYYGAQVGEEESVPEPEKIQVLHRVGGVLKVVDLRLEQKLGDLFGEGFLLHGELAEEGYFATLGGRLLDSNKSVANLGLQQGQEVVFHRRLRGGGFSGGGKGAREGRANSVAAGDWTCGICHQPGCWNAKSTCYRCGAPRHQSQGLSGQANSGARDMEGRYQSGVGTGMGGYRVVGPNGRDQSSIPGGNATQRKGPQPGGKGRNKVGGDTGAGVGVGFGTGGGVVGGGGGGDIRSAFSWLGGGGGVGNPLPPGIVLSERDQAQLCGALERAPKG